MLFTPPSLNTTWQNSLPATPSQTTTGVTVTAIGIHGEGNYAQVIASTTYDSYGFHLALYNSRVSATDTSMLLDIAYGGAGSEVVVLTNFLCGFIGSGPADGGPHVCFIPLFIPKATRVSARIQSLITGDSVTVGVWLNGGPNAPCPIFTACDTYGANAADSGGTAHTPGNSGAESTDAAIGTASRNYKAIMLRLGTSGITAISNMAYHWEFTNGTNTLCEWYSQTATTESINGPFPMVPFNVDIPSGMSMQIQAEASGTAQAHDVAYYCFY